MSDLDIEQRPRGGCGFWPRLAALALHVGGAALALAHLQGRRRRRRPGRQRRRDRHRDGLAAGSRTTDLPPGPDYRRCRPQRPALPEQKAEVKETDLPKDTPTETEDADRVVTTNESKKPTGRGPKVAAVRDPGHRRH